MNGALTETTTSEESAAAGSAENHPIFPSSLPSLPSLPPLHLVFPAEMVILHRATPDKYVARL